MGFVVFFTSRTPIHFSAYSSFRYSVIISSSDQKKKYKSRTFFFKVTFFNLSVILQILATFSRQLKNQKHKHTCMKSERNNLLIEKKQLVIKFSMGYDFF